MPRWLDDPAQEGGVGESGQLEMDLWRDIMEKQSIDIPQIVLDWSDWYPWDLFTKDVRTDPDSSKSSSKTGGL